MGDRAFRHDAYYKKAKEQRFVSRAIFKIEEIDKRFHIFQKGDRVLDLGAAPGSWMQYTLRAVGPGGRVTGIDLLPLRIQLPPHGRFLLGDIRETSAEALMAPEGTPFDVVVSDMAPNTIGVKFTDSARSAELVQLGIRLTDQILKPGGKFVAKIFQGEDFDETLRLLKTRFVRFKVVKPDSSRPESKEVYLVAWERREQAIPV